MARALAILRWVGLTVALVGGCVLTLAALVVAAVAVVLAAVDEPRGEPRSFFWGNVAPLFTVAALAVVVAVYVWLFVRLVVRRPARFRFFPLVTAPLVFFALALSVPADPPDVSLGAATFLRERYGIVRHDIVLVVDPGDAGGRAVIAQALRAGTVDASPGPRWDVRYAVVILDPLPGREGHWRLALDFTSDRKKVARALGAIAAVDRGPALVTYGRLLSDLLDGRVRSRSSLLGAQTSIAFFLGALPTSAELDTAVDEVVEASAARRLQAARRYCRGPKRPPLTYRQCIAAFGQTQPLGLEGPIKLLQPWLRLQVRSAADGTRLIVVTADERMGRRDEWRRKLRTVVGSRLVPLAGEATRQPLAELERAATGPVMAWQQRLALKYRPYLYFDSLEQFGPLDVDRFLAESAFHFGCPAETSSRCHRVDSGYTILNEYDHLDLAGGARAGSDLRRDLHETDAHRMYYHLTAGPGRDGRPRVHLDYWWFLRFNISPVRTSESCLAGLSIGDASCFDHEGDWEGVTVTLRVENGRARPERVTYAGHREVQRYDWPMLVGKHAVRAETHPAVYVAFGSHAAYPGPCYGSSTFLGGCNQGDIRLFGVWRLPEGRHDGMEEWPLNDEDACKTASCVVPLPVGPRGPALWNAFTGRWGGSECSLVGRFCVKTEGPLTPAAQERYRDPS